MRGNRGPIAVAFVFLVTIVGTAGSPPATADHYAGIQPGALLGDTCTMNLIFSDDDGVLYLGVASHCVHGLGSRVVVPGIGSMGTVVFDKPFSTLEMEQGLPQLDFALVRIDTDKYHVVDPTVRAWGGPTAVAHDVLPGTPMLHYGQGIGFQSTEASRARTGVFQYTVQEGVFAGWWMGTSAFLGGDSGSPVLTADGAALGFISALIPTFSAYSMETAPVGGPMFATVLAWLHAAGWDVDVVTTESQDLLAESVARGFHCVAEPVATPAEPDGCYRDGYKVYRMVTPEAPRKWWNENAWAVGNTRDPALCRQLPYDGGIGVTLCKEAILIVEAPADLWATNLGGLQLDVDWPPGDGDVDVYVYDMDGNLVGQSATEVPGEESLFIPDIEPAHYQILLVPTDYEALPFGGQGMNVVADLQIEASAT